jgi:UDP-3-O-[3-hydroxymyristoyl] glucosamine N-acyltransferase
MELTIDQVAQLIGGQVEGDGTATLNRLEKIEDATEGSIAFLANLKYIEFVYSTRASAVIVANDFVPNKGISTTLIKVEDPYTAFSALLAEYEKLLKVSKSGIENPSFQSNSSEIGNEVYLGAFSHLGDNVKLGNNVKIYPNVVLGDNVTVGDDTIIHAGVQVYANCIIGSSCTLHSGAVIGSAGFGYAPQPDGTFKTVPQVGNVIIEDFVDIGANTVIDCATMGSTVIHSGVKLDNLVQIAHNVEIGKNTAIAAQAGISGSAKIGENCQIGGQAGITGHLKLANRITIGPQAGVPKTINEEGGIYFGSPIMDHREFLKMSIVLRRLPELLRRVNQLEKNS